MMASNILLYTSCTHQNTCTFFLQKIAVGVPIPSTSKMRSQNTSNLDGRTSIIIIIREKSLKLNKQVCLSFSAQWENHHDISTYIMLPSRISISLKLQKENFIGYSKIERSLSPLGL